MTTTRVGAPSEERFRLYAHATTYLRSNFGGAADALAIQYMDRKDGLHLNIMF